MSAVASLLICACSLIIVVGMVMSMILQEFKNEYLTSYLLKEKACKCSIIGKILICVSIALAIPIDLLAAIFTAILTFYLYITEFILGYVKLLRKN